MRRTALPIVALALLVMLTAARAFWLEPKKFIHKKDETLTVNFIDGENFSGNRWDFRDHTVAEFTHHSMTTSTNLLPRLSRGELSNIEIPLKESGTHVLSVEGDPAVRDVDAETFNEALKEDGLDDILSRRQRSGQTNQPVRETVVRSAKLLIQVDDVSGSVFRKPVGHALELVPVNNPYLTKTGEELKFTVLFDGKPLPFTKVYIWNRKLDRVLVQPIYTQQDGTISTRMSNDGAWMLSVVHMIWSPDSESDYKTYRASLVFGFD